MRALIKKFAKVDLNTRNRQAWLKATLAALPPGLRLLDAGAGELQNKPHCAHLAYVSQDLCEYDGVGDMAGLQTGGWDTSRIDIVCDIEHIPEPDGSFDAVLCSEVFEHLPSPEAALVEFQRLLKPGGKVILTAPFSSNVHFAPYHYATGFSRYWYQHYLAKHGFDLLELTPNGDWFSVLRQEMLRWPAMAKKYHPMQVPLAYIFAVMALLFLPRGKPRAEASELACFGWHCVAQKKKPA